MTLEGWAITKYMCAGLIPGVNIKTKPRVFYLFILHEIAEAAFRVNAAIASNPDTDAIKMHEKLFEIALPALSPRRMLEEDAKKLFAKFEAMQKMNKKAKK